MYYGIFQSFALVASLTLWYCVCRKFFDVQNKPTPTNGAYTTGKLELHVDLVNLMATPQVSYTKLPHCCSSYIAVLRDAELSIVFCALTYNNLIHNE